MPGEYTYVALMTWISQTRPGRGYSTTPKKERLPIYERKPPLRMISPSCWNGFIRHPLALRARREVTGRLWTAWRVGYTFGHD